MSTYHRPAWYRRRIVNPVFELVAGRLGIAVRGVAVLAVPGRKTGLIRTVPVYPLTLGGQRYLVAPPGETEWVRNLRASGQGELRIGRRIERFTAVEVADGDKPPILRAYLDRWYPEAGPAFGVPKTASLVQLAAISSWHPVFRISRA